MSAAQAPRWKATITYHSQFGKVVTEHFMEEISELHDIIEAGPNFYCMAHCVVTLADPTQLIAIEDTD